MVKRKGIIFSHLQNFKKFKYPEFIKKILIEAAFDSPATLRTIEKSVVEKIETFVNNKTDLLKGTIYVDEAGNLKKTPFKFMPGHESLILGFPKDIDEYLSNKKLTKSEIPKIDDLKKLFIERVKTFAETKKLTFTLNSEDLSKFVRNNNRVKCEANCPFCQARTSCTFDSSWKITNYYKHIVSCAKKVTTTRSLIERASPAVLSQLQNVLP